MLLELLIDCKSRIGGTAELMIQRVSLFQVSVANGQLFAAAGGSYDASKYSRFKYGDAELAERYATGLVERLSGLDGLLMQSRHFSVITTAPFKYIPTASFELAKRIRRHLRVALCTTREDPINIVPLYMRNVDSDNYSARSQLERKKILDHAGLYVDSRSIRGRNVLLVDDAIVSGTAEQEAISVLTVAGASFIIGAYVIEVEQDYGRNTPEIEDQLNHAFVKDLDSLLEVFQTAPIKLNIRTIKFVLGWPELREVERFFKSINSIQLTQLFRAVMEDKNAFAKNYPSAVELLVHTARSSTCLP